MVEPLGPAPDGEGVRSKRLRALIRYWNEKRGDRSMPLSNAIDPIEIPRLLTIVLIADVTTDGTRIRLMGTEATAAYGREIRGQLIDEIEFGAFAPLWREVFALVATSAAPASAGGAFHNGKQDCGVEIVLMPLTDDGVSTGRILGGLSIRPLAQGSVTSRPIPRTYIAPVMGDIDGMTGWAECSGG